MKCPHCKEEIDKATYTETTSGWVDFGITNQEGKTIIDEWDDETSKETNFYCPNCGEDITAEILIE